MSLFVQRNPNTGNNALDDIVEGSDDSNAKTPDKGWETPLSQSEFENQLGEIPGATVTPHSGGGVVVELEDGTTISTYPQRDSEPYPGYSIDTLDGNQIKGSLTGTDE